MFFRKFIFIDLSTQIGNIDQDRKFTLLTTSCLRANWFVLKYL